MPTIANILESKNKNVPFLKHLLSMQYSINPTIKTATPKKIHTAMECVHIPVRDKIIRVPFTSKIMSVGKGNIAVF